jgi:hypothetical protein
MATVQTFEVMSDNFSGSENWSKAHKYVSGLNNFNLRLLVASIPIKENRS